MAAAAESDVGCSCVPAVPRASRRLACVLCKGRHHFECTLGLPASEWKAFEAGGNRFLCTACAALNKEGAVFLGDALQTESTTKFACCKASFDGGQECFPCAGCKSYVHAMCIGVADDATIDALQRYHTRWYCAGCTPTVKNPRKAAKGGKGVGKKR